MQNKTKMTQEGYEVSLLTGEENEASLLDVSGVVAAGISLMEERIYNNGGVWCKLFIAIDVIHDFMLHVASCSRVFPVSVMEVVMISAPLGRFHRVMFDLDSIEGEVWLAQYGLWPQCRPSLLSQ